MKKLLVFLLVTAMVFSLVGCSKSNDSNKDTTQNTPAQGDQQQPQPKEELFEPGATLVVWESDGGDGEFMKFAAQEFEKKYGITVKYEHVGSVDTVPKLQTDGPAGVGADVFAAPHDKTGEIAVSGLAHPNDMYKDRANDFMEGAIAGVSYQGVLYGYPTAIETYALYYNKDLVTKVPQTYAEIVEFAKTYNDPRNNKWALMWDIGNAYFSHSFIAGYGGYVFGQGGTDKNDIGLNNEGAIKGAEFFRSLKEIFPVNSADANYGAMDGSFIDGNAAMIINGPWAVSGYKDAGVNFGVAPLPLLGNGSNPASFSGIRSLFVSSYTKYPKAAKLFADFVTSEEMLVKRFEMTTQIPPHKNLMDAPQIQNDPIVLGFMAQTEFAVPMPSIPEVSLMWDPYGAAFSTLWNENTDVKAIMDNAAKTLSDAIKAQSR